MNCTQWMVIFLALTATLIPSGMAVREDTSIAVAIKAHGEVAESRADVAHGEVTINKIINLSSEQKPHQQPGGSQNTHSPHHNFTQEGSMRPILPVFTLKV